MVAHNMVGWSLCRSSHNIFMNSDCRWLSSPLCFPWSGWILPNVPPAGRPEKGELKHHTTSSPQLQKHITNTKIHYKYKIHPFLSADLKKGDLQNPTISSKYSLIKTFFVTILVGFFCQAFGVPFCKPYTCCQFCLRYQHGEACQVSIREGNPSQEQLH